ncbi:MAG: hypothetical protein ACOC80_06435 [Petrotogales bacterium]
MANKKQLSFRLSKELDDWLKTEIEAGTFESMSDAVEQALVELRKEIDGKEQ